MATPPFVSDNTDPGDTSTVSQFPANERVHRDEIFSFVATEHDAASGHHTIPNLTTTAINAETNWPNGGIVFDTTLGTLKINLGTAGAPNWFQIGAVAAGMMMPFGGSTAPTGYLLCDGSAVSRTTYAALFAVVSTNFGAGDGTTTFNVPDLRGRAAFGLDNMGSGAANRLGTGSTGGITGGATMGAAGGQQSHTLSVTEIPSHSHTANVTDPGHAHSLGAQSANPAAGFLAFTSGTGNNTTLASTGISVTNANTGGGGAHNVLPPALVTNYIIKT